MFSQYTISTAYVQSAHHLSYQFYPLVMKHWMNMLMKKEDDKLDMELGNAPEYKYLEWLYAGEGN